MFMQYSMVYRRVCVHIYAHVTYAHICVHVWMISMSNKCPTSGGQTADQEAAVQQTFHLERKHLSSFGTNGKDLM